MYFSSILPCVIVSWTDEWILRCLYNCTLPTDLQKLPKLLEMMLTHPCHLAISFPEKILCTMQHNYRCLLQNGLHNWSIGALHQEFTKKGDISPCVGIHHNPSLNVIAFNACLEPQCRNNVYQSMSGHLSLRPLTDPRVWDSSFCFKIVLRQLKQFMSKT